MSVTKVPLSEAQRKAHFKKFCLWVYSALTSPEYQSEAGFKAFYSKVLGNSLVIEMFPDSPSGQQSPSLTHLLRTVND